MEQHQLECEKKYNFIEAELARQRVEQLKKIKVKKDYKIAKTQQVKQKDELLDDQKEEIAKCNNEFDDKDAELLKSFDELKKELVLKHANQIEDLKIEIEKKMEKKDPKNGNISNELAEAKRVLEYFAKNKEYKSIL